MTATPSSARSSAITARRPRRSTLLQRLAALRKAQVYIIVSPDIPVKNPNPHYMQPRDANQIAEWVKSGGVLMIMENDAANADLDHINPLAERFGIHFNSVLRKHVVGSDWAMGKIVVDGNGLIFHHPHTLYMKDVCTISVKPPAVAQLTDNGDILMATAKYGKGTVFANVDPMALQRVHRRQKTA